MPASHLTYYNWGSQEFLDDGNGKVAGVRTVKVEWTKDPNGRWKMDEVEGSEKVNWLMFPFPISQKIDQ